MNKNQDNPYQQPCHRKSSCTCQKWHVLMQRIQEEGSTQASSWLGPEAWASFPFFVHWAFAADPFERLERLHSQDERWRLSSRGGEPGWQLESLQS